MKYFICSIVGGIVTTFVLYTLGCTAEQIAAVQPIVNPDGALDTLLNTPVVHLKEAAPTYLRDILASASGGLTLGSIIGLFIDRPGTKKKMARLTTSAQETGRIQGTIEATDNIEKIRVL